MLPAAGQSSSRAVAAAAVAGVLLAMVLLALLSVSVAGRAGYPFELEWMEGVTAVHVARLLAGERIYGPPTLEFVPLAYPALYYYASLPAAWVLGAGFTPLRLVSIAATAVTLVAIFAVVRRESGAAAGVIAAGAYAGAYPLSDGWYDVGRVDGLYVAWLALTYLTAVRARTAVDWCLCGTLAAAAFATKQPAVVVVAPLAVYLCVTNWRSAVWFGGAFVLLSGVMFLALNVRTDGWYAYYLVELPQLRMEVSSRRTRALSFWTSDMAPMLVGVVVGGAVIGLTRCWRHASMVAGLIGAAWLARLEGGAWNNAVMPAYLAAALLLGISLAPRVAWPGVRWTLAVLQLALLIFDPRPFMPTAAHRAQGAAFLESLRALPQPVLVMDHGFWAAAAGLPEYAHGWAVTDIVWADRTGAGPALEQTMRTAIEEQRFGTIIVDGERSWFRKDLEAYYAPRHGVDAPPPLSGASRRPALALGPR